MGEISGAWIAKESVRDIYLVEDTADAATLVDEAIAGCLQDDVPEIQSLGLALFRRRTEILSRHLTGASQLATEGLNLVIKKLKGAAHGFRRFRMRRAHNTSRCALRLD